MQNDKWLVHLSLEKGLFTALELTSFVETIHVSPQAVRGELSQFVDEMVITDSMVK